MAWATLIAPSSAVAAIGPIAYAIAGHPEDDGPNDLYRLDLGTGQATFVGSTGQLLTGLAVAPSGDLFASGIFNTLFRVDPTTAALSPIGTTTGGLSELDFDDDRLLSTDFAVGSTTVYQVDTATAGTTPIATATGPGIPTGFAALGDGTAYLFVAQDATANFFRMDLTTGDAAPLGLLVPPTVVGMRGPNSLRGLDTDPATGAVFLLGDNGDVFRVDATPGMVGLSLIGNSGGQFWLDLAIPSTPIAVPEPVPEPGSVGLMVVGLGTVVGAWKAKKRARPGDV